MKKRYIISVDQGTSATKAVVVDDKGSLIDRFNTIHKQYHPNPGWVEHDPVEIYNNTVNAILSVMEKASLTEGDIAAISITNQRETSVVWDKRTGKPICNAVVWQCSRAGNISDRLIEEGWNRLIKEKTGMHISPYFSAAKIMWMLDNIPNARKDAEEGHLLFGTIDSWLIWNLTDGKKHATDYSNACRTQLLNINTLKWDIDLLEIFNIPKSMMPKVKYSDEMFGETNLNGKLKKKIPITGVMGDSHAALFGQNCFEIGTGKATMGTGSSIMLNIGKRPYQSNNGIVTSIAWGTKGEVEYVFEGNINCSGDTIKWLVDEMGILPDAKSSEEYAMQVKDNNGVYLVPAFVGMGAPYWENNAKACIIGISRGTNKYHIVRAGLEAIAYQIKDIIEIMVKDAGIELKELRVDGGPTRNDFVMQFLADILRVNIIRNEVEELSAVGVAYMAGLALGIWKDKEEIKSLRCTDDIFEMKLEDSEVKSLYDGWLSSIRKVLYNC